MLASSLALGSDILAVVNGENITSDVAPKDFKKLDKDMQTKILNRLVEKRLAIQYALADEIVETETYKTSLEHILQMSATKKNKDASLANIFNKDAKIKGYTSEQLNSKKGLLAFDFILNRKSETTILSDKQLKEFYEARKYKYDTPAQLELLTIVVADKKLADSLIKQIDKSENKLETFRTLAEKNSLAPSAKDSGYFGKLVIKELNDTLKPGLKDLKRGQYTKSPIKSDFGYHVFYVLNDIPEFNSTLESVKSQVEDELMKQEIKNWAMNKIKELKENAKIQIKI